MTGEPKSLPESGRSALEDLEIFCPHCDYNLRGLTEERCPECGNAFDRDLLFLQTQRHRQPLPFGYRYSQKTSFFMIIYASLFDPARLGRELPAYPNVGDAIGYSFGIRLMSIIVFAVMLSIPNSGGYVIIFAFVAFIIALLSIIHEVFIAALLSWFVAPSAIPRGRRYLFWLTMCHCFSTHFLLTMCLFSTLTFAFAWLGFSPRSQVFYISFFLVPILIFLWWWYCLGRAVLQRGLPSMGRTFTVLLAPILGPACIVLFFLSIRFW